MIQCVIYPIQGFDTFNTRMKSKGVQIHPRKSTSFSKYLALSLAVIQLTGFFSKRFCVYSAWNIRYFTPFFSYFKIKISNTNISKLKCIFSFNFFHISYSIKTLYKSFVFYQGCKVFGRGALIMAHECCNKKGNPSFFKEHVSKARQSVWRIIEIELKSAF